MPLASPFCLLPRGDIRAAVHSHILSAFEAESRGKQQRVLTGSFVRFYQDNKSVPEIPPPSQRTYSQVPLTRTRSHGHAGYKECLEVRGQDWHVGLDQHNLLSEADHHTTLN